MNTTLESKPIVMVQPVLKTLPVSELRTDHPFYSLFEIEAKQFFIDNFQRRGQSVRPLTVKSGEDHFVLSDIRHVLAAKESGVEQFEVFEYPELSEVEIIRLICDSTAGMHIKGHPKLYAIVKYLKDFMDTESGKELYDSLPGTDTKDKLAQVINRSEQTVQNLLTVGNAGLIEDVGNGLKWDEAINQARAIQQSRKMDAAKIETVVAAVRELLACYQQKSSPGTFNKYDPETGIDISIIDKDLSIEMNYTSPDFSITIEI